MQCGEQPANNIQHPVMQSCNLLQADRYCVCLWPLAVCAFFLSKTLFWKIWHQFFWKSRGEIEHCIGVGFVALSIPMFLCLKAFNDTAMKLSSARIRHAAACPRNTIHGTPSTRHPPGIPRPQPGLVSCQVHQQSDGFGLLFCRDSMVEVEILIWGIQAISGYIRLYQAISGYIYRTSITSFWKKKPSNTEQRNVLRIAADRCVAVSCSLLRASADTDSSWQQLTAADIGSVGNRSQDITSCNAKDGRCGDVRIKDDLHIRTSFPQREYQYHWTSLNIIEYHGISRKSNMECCLWHLRSVNSQDFPTFQPPHGWI